MSQRFTPEIMRQVERELADQGFLIEAGWVGMLHLVYGDTPPAHANECRDAFFAGAGHLLYSLERIIDAEKDPTANDMRRLDMLDRELKAFIADRDLLRGPAEGSA